MIQINLKSFLEQIDYRRDRLLFPLIKGYWPRKITPNHLTSLRIIIGIILCILLFSGFEDKTCIVPLFCFAVLLDLFDGSVARALNKKTDIGAFLDPLGDKILIIPVAVYCLIKHYKWLLLLLVLPELISLVGVIFYKVRNRIIEANIFGKTKMVLESVAFGVILLNWPSTPSKFPVILLFFAVFFGSVGTLLTWLNLSKNSQIT